MSDSFRPYGQQPARLFCPQDSLGKNTGVGCHFLLHKGKESWIFIVRTEPESETPILWPPDMKNWLIWKDPSAGKDWRWEEKGATEDEMVGWQSLTQWTWVWVNPGSWWWTGRPGVLQSMGLQTVGHEWVTELNWIMLEAYYPQRLKVIIHTSWHLELGLMKPEERKQPSHPRLLTYKTVKQESYVVLSC